MRSAIFKASALLLRLGHLQARLLPKEPPKPPKQKKSEEAEEEEEEDEEDEAAAPAAAAAPRSAFMQFAQAAYWCDYLDNSLGLLRIQFERIAPLRRRRAMAEYACARLQLALVDARLCLQHGRKTFESAFTVPISMEQLCGRTLIQALEQMKLVDIAVRHFAVWCCSCG